MYAVFILLVRVVVILARTAPTPARNGRQPTITNVMSQPLMKAMMKPAMKVDMCWMNTPTCGCQQAT